MKSFPKISISRPVIYLLAVILLLWLIGPVIPVGGSKPLSSISARMGATGIILLLSMVFFVIDLFIKHKAQTLPKLKEILATVWKAIKQFSVELTTWITQKFGLVKGRVYEDKQGRLLRRQPWYLVMGSGGAGKSSSIANSGLIFLPPEKLGNEAITYVQQFPDYDWWYTDDGVLIDLTNQGQSPDENNNAGTVNNWKKFIKLLKKQRRNKPIAGLLLHFSLTDLLHKDNQHRQNELYNICLHLRELNETFKVQIPVYLVFTKCDLVEGFVEYFSDLSREDLSQVWGATFPLAEASDMNSVAAAFNREYQSLMERLSQQLLWKMDIEKNDNKRELIHAFPHQMRLFRKPIETLIFELFGAVRINSAIQLRGFYFTSASQVGKPHNLLVNIYAKKFHLNSVMQRNQLLQTSDGYFLTQLYRDVILQDGKVLGYSERVQNLQTLFYKGVRYALPVAVVIGTYSMYSSYEHNKKAIMQVRGNLEEYHRAYQHLRIDDMHLQDTLPALNALNSANNVYKKTDNPWLMGLLPSSHRTKHATEQALEGSINTLFLPRVAAQLENNLHHPMDDANLLYATLKGYLTFSPSDATDPTSLEEPMYYQWAKTFKKDIMTDKQLKYYLNLAMANDIEKLPLDRRLINDARGKLEQVVPEKRAYGLLSLSSSTSNLPNINFSDQIGSTFYEVFVDHNDVSDIPSLYSSAGYNKVFNPHSNDIARQVAQDNKAIGLTTDEAEQQSDSEIMGELDQEYENSYVKEWQQHLRHLEVVPFTSLQQAATVLGLLASNQSPLADVLSITKDNTSRVKNANINIAKDFETLNAYTNEHHTTAKMRKINQSLAGLHDYMLQISQAADSNAAAYKAAEDYMQGKLSNPIRQLTLEAKGAPEPLKTWLNSVADNSWAVILQGAMNYINTAWKNQVYSEYDDQLKDRYPLSPHARGQVSVDAFSHFFAPKGTLSQFFNKYLASFVDTSKTPWQLYNLNGHSLKMSSHELRLFEQAAAIQHRYFPDGGAKPKLQYAIKPHTLDDNASKVNLSIGHVVLTYNHGPQQPVSVIWPQSSGEDTVKVNITGFNGEHYVRSYDGPWAFFKLLDRSHLQGTTDPDKYLFVINGAGHRASFDIQSTESLANFKLTDVKGFGLPEKL